MTRWTQEDINRFEAKKGQNLSKKAAIPKMSANTLTKHVIKLLDLKGFNVWRQNNGAVYDEKKKCFRKNSATPGISDIIGYHRKTGQFIACEIKAGKDKLSEDQRLFLERVNRSGGIGIEVRRIEDLEVVNTLQSCATEAELELKKE